MNLNNKTLYRIANIVTKIAQEAGKILIQHFRTDNFIYIQKPGKANIATNVDLLVQHFIIENLLQNFPTISILAEESDENQSTKNKLCFLVDPLDGTLNFVHGLPFFAVSIALVKESKPVVGVVHAPILEETFTAIMNHGAFMNGQKLQCSKNISWENALGVTGWPYDPDFILWTQKILLLMQQKIQEVRILGTAALEMCYVAAGIIDIYWEVGLKPWDLAAGSLIVSEAGGIVSDITGRAFDLFSGRVLACRSKQLFRYALKLLNSLDCK
jgi:myo-inositol-1(or 4)-monophosphatase